MILKKIVPTSLVLTLALAYCFGAVIVYGEYRYQETREANQTLKTSLHETEETLETTKHDLHIAEDQIAIIVATLTGEQQKNNSLADQLRSVAGTVGTLEKLSKTDRELLKKYSKVYFLNENYVPLNLATIDTKYLFYPDKPLEFHGSVYSRLAALMDAANQDAITLKIISAYRSFGTQSALKTTYKVLYGAGSANSFSADQGYSEHQLGTTVDFTTPEAGAGFTKFDATPAFGWLTQNAYKYGFVLSYPKNNAYYVYEPWHWRYVGISLATRLHNEGKYFYDLDQRVIDEYLVSIFD
jgi:LAS superfamily LD-carboxypeptidase LdcB